MEEKSIKTSSSQVRQADVPAGLSNLLHLAAGNVQVEDADAVGI
ncbi:hypothetical protein [Phocaeicola sp.]